MNKIQDNWLKALFQRLGNAIQDKKRTIVLLSSFYVALVIISYVGFLQSDTLSRMNLAEFEPGRVADRDIIASRELSYVDENATAIRRESRKQLVTPVFRYDQYISNNMIDTFTAFTSFLGSTALEAKNADEFVLRVSAEYPDTLERQDLRGLFQGIRKTPLLQTANSIFIQLVSEGIAEFPDEGIEEYNQNTVETVRTANDRQLRSDIPRDALLTEEKIPAWIENALKLTNRNADFLEEIYLLIRPFIQINYIFHSDESETKLDTAVRQVPPVLVVIQKGQRIIRRGFIITPEAFLQLEALAKAGGHIDVRQFVGTILLLLIITLLAVFMFSYSIFGAVPGLRNMLLLLSSFSIVYIGVLVLTRVMSHASSIDFAAILPLALITMLITVFMGQKTGVFMTIILSLGVIAASGYQLLPFVFSLLSGFSGVAVIKSGGKRIDLVKSACFLALLHPFILAILALLQKEPVTDLVSVLFVSSVNGFMSGILVLGFLPILEALLNTCSSFRLMEFSDLNSPIMKKMLLSASGTYNHSILVATLAESACRAIGADPLLARVGAYYHDIGKMDQSEYFVENQTNYNKHTDMNPRLSATVIRSHVKQGIEKAHQMRLPREVIDIIAEHHGNSVISFFYNEAKKIEGEVNPEDFMYPGNPPKSRESAVVMLADVVEAACRTLDKPSVPRLEKFVGELIDHKIQMGQLDNSELTFREIGSIKRSFVNILAGYYHSRIEYPNQKDMLPDIPQKDSRVTKRKKNE